MTPFPLTIIMFLPVVVFVCVAAMVSMSESLLNNKKPFAQDK
ncbi:hypothetical protein [Alteromonas sp. 5E99-2]|nr:hypothetical protein [Alteromonas sp. 5E99-2]